MHMVRVLNHTMFWQKSSPFKYKKIHLPSTLDIVIPFKIVPLPVPTKRRMWHCNYVPFMVYKQTNTPLFLWATRMILRLPHRTHSGANNFSISVPAVRNVSRSSVTKRARWVMSYVRIELLRFSKYRASRLITTISWFSRRVDIFPTLWITGGSSYKQFQQPNDE